MQNARAVHFDLGFLNDLNLMHVEGKISSGFFNININDACKTRSRGLICNRNGSRKILYLGHMYCFPLQS